MDIEKINSIVELFKNSGLDEMTLELKDFKINLKNNKVEINSKIGFYTKVDLGIVKCHFELGVGKEHYCFEY